MKNIFYLMLLSLSLIISCSDTNEPSNNPIINSISKTTFKSGDILIINGSKFGSTQGNSAVTFGTINATKINSWSDNSIEVQVPNGVVSGNLFVTVNNLKSNLIAYNVSQNYMPNTLGSYWIYNVYNIDTTNNRANKNNPNLDSLIIIGTETKLSKTATIFENNINNNTGYYKGSNWYFTKENENIYVFSGLFNEMLGFNNLPIKLPFTIEDKWMLIYDSKNSKWNMHSKTFNNDSVNYQTIKGTFSGTFTIDAEKIGLEDVALEGTLGAVKAQKIKYILKVNGNFNTMLGPIPVSVAGNIYFWFADNIGLAKFYFESQRFTVTGLLDQKLEGKEQVLIRYNIK